MTGRRPRRPPHERLLEFDNNDDGTLTKEEVTDKRLKRLFDRIDEDGDGTVSTSDIEEFFEKQAPAAAGDRPRVRRRDGELGPPDRPAPRARQEDGSRPGPGDVEFGPPQRNRRGRRQEFDRPGPPPPGHQAGDNDRPRGRTRRLDQDIQPGPDRPDRGNRMPPAGPPQAGQILPGHLQDSLNLTDEQRQELKTLQKHVDNRLAEILSDEQRAQLKRRGPNVPFGRHPRGPRPPQGRR